MPRAMKSSLICITALLLVIEATQLIAQTAKNSEKPPKAEFAIPWSKLIKVSPDCSVRRIDTLSFQVGTLIAAPVSGGRQVHLGEIRDLDYVPSAWWDSSGIAVYKKHGDWVLVHSKTSGWYWAFLDPKELKKTNQDPEFSPSQVLSEGLDSLDYTLKDNDLDKFSTDKQGYRIYSQIRTIEIPLNEPLRSKPNTQSQSLGHIEAEYCNILGFDGDWVQIQEPLELEMIPGGDDHNDLLKVKWDPARTGWVRWRIKGPVPGSYRIFLRGITFFGVID